MTSVPSRCDVLVIGAGVAGLSAAYSAARAGASVVVVTEVPVLEAHSAQGVGMNGLASRRFDWREHAAETIKGSDFSADPHVVALMCRDAEPAILELVGLGAPFDFDRIGDFGAFTFHTPSLTGTTILRALYAAVHAHPRCVVVEGARITALLLDRTVMAIAGGVVAHLDGETAVDARSTVLATGGCGAIFEPTTNAAWCTGEGLALAYLAGAELADLEMTQFHPTALPDGTLVSESARGAGAVLRNRAGVAFMTTYAPRFAELAPRDIVARAVHEQSEGGATEVYLDFTAIDGRYWDQPHILKILEDCLRVSGVDIRESWVAVKPAMHYHMGGVLTDVDGRTSLHGLYAAGEVACTGSHGANRLGGNSLLEARVFGRRAGSAAALEAQAATVAPSRALDVGTVATPNRDSDYGCGPLMTRYCGIIRCADELEILEKHLEAEPPSSRRLVAQLIATAAHRRRESRGVQHRADFPRRDEGWCVRQVVRRDEAGGPQWRDEPIRPTTSLPAGRDY